MTKRRDPVEDARHTLANLDLADLQQVDAALTWLAQYRAHLFENLNVDMLIWSCAAVDSLLDRRNELTS